MSLIKFMFSRNKEKSILASQKYGEKQVNLEDLDLPILARRIYPTLEEREKPMKLGKVCRLGRKEYPKLFTQTEENEKEV